MSYNKREASTHKISGQKIFTRCFHSLEHFSYSPTSSVSLDYPPLSPSASPSSVCLSKSRTTHAAEQSRNHGPTAKRKNDYP